MGAQWEHQIKLRDVDSIGNTSLSLKPPLMGSEENLDEDERIGKKSS